jgi:hypothetical protein
MDLEYGAPRIKVFNEKGNEASLEDALDQLEEAHDIALLHSAKYHQSLRRYHARCIHGRAFSVDDLVLRLKQSNKEKHKLTPPWEGPYIIAEVLRPGTYKIATMKGEVFTNTWNIEQLRHFYP